MFNKAFTYPVGSKVKRKPLSLLAEEITSKEVVPDTAADASFFRDLEEQSIYLNPQQVAAVRSLNGPQLIIAGAGSGKTRVLTARTAYILKYDRSVKARELLMLTFTKKAASEMLERIQAMMPDQEDITNEITCGTFHSVFLKILRNNGCRRRILGSETYKEVIIKKLLRSHHLDEHYPPEAIIAAISSWKNQMKWPEFIKAESKIESDLVKMYAAYEEWREEQELMDFDDILLETYSLLAENESILQELKDRYKYISIDEFQDTCKVQYEIVRLLSDENSNIIFVGDEDQLIYGFRDASPDFILNLVDYPELNRTYLTTNYRSSSAIVGLANKLISFNTFRLGKTCLSANHSEEGVYYVRPEHPEEEAKWICDHIIKETINQAKKYENFSVLFRTHSHSRAVVDELVTRNIPFIVYGNDNLFYNHRIVKPLLSHIRLAIHGDDIEAIGDIAPTLYISRESAINNAEEFLETNFDKAALLSLLHLDLKPFQKQKVVQRVTLIKRLEKLNPVQAIQALRKAFYNDFLDLLSSELTVQKQALQELLDECEAAATRFNDIPSFIHFIDRITEVYEGMEETRKNPKAEAVKLMTIHQSKGLEFQSVFLIGAAENMMPHPSAENADKQVDRINGMNSITALEEERRLLYVAITRAQNELFISSPRKVHNKEVEVSRFLIETYSN